MTRGTQARENLLVIQDKAELMAAYQRVFAEHLGHAERYDR